MSLSLGIGLGSVRGGTATASWTRPADWLPLPDIQPPTEGIAALVAVSEDGYSNLVSLKMTISDSATWTVDWGDGSTPEVIASGATATHDYDWADVGDVTSEGWRQAVLTVYPATGKTFATINLAAPVGEGVRNSKWTSSLHDVLVCAATASSVLMSDITTRGGNNSLLRRLQCRSANALTYLPSVKNCPSLEQLIVPDISTSVAHTNGLFNSARVPDNFDLSALTTLNSVAAGGFLPRRVTMDVSGKAAQPISVLVHARGCVACSISGGAAMNAWSNFAYTADSSSWLVDLVIDVVAGTAAGLVRYAPLVRSVVIGDASGITDTTNAFQTCPALEKLILAGLTIGVSIASCNLGAAALNAFFTSLGTAAGAQTLTITGNPGAATCDTSIATAKGWTVAV